jgi:hypothetical protein
MNNETTHISFASVVWAHRRKTFWSGACRSLFAFNDYQILLKIAIRPCKQTQKCHCSSCPTVLTYSDFWESSNARSFVSRCDCRAADLPTSSYRHQSRYSVWSDTIQKCCWGGCVGQTSNSSCCTATAHLEMCHDFIERIFTKTIFCYFNAIDHRLEHL